jgi:methyl-accepting chemotaxis protein
MDTSSYVYIGLAAATGVGTVVWYWVRRIQMGLDANEKALNGKADAADVKQISDAVHESRESLKDDLNEFKLECQRSFVSNPELTRVMTSLNLTIQQLTIAIQHNAQESRDGIKAINDRIDNLMHNRTP